MKKTIKSNFRNIEFRSNPGHHSAMESQSNVRQCILGANVRRSARILTGQGQLLAGAKDDFLHICTNSACYN